MNWYSDLCDKTIKIRSESKHLQSFSHTESSKCIRLKNIIQNLDLFDIDETFNGCITDRH